MPTILEPETLRLSRRRLLAGAACASAALWLGSGAASAASPAALGGAAFGTYWRATLTPGADTALARAAIEAVIAEIDSIMSPYNADSEISRFNRLSVSEFAASASLCAVTEEGLRVAALSDGAFDPTVGPSVHRFGFGPVTGAGGDHTKIVVTDGCIAKSAPHITLDLCGIAKGYALDQMGAALLAQGVRDFVIDLGGEVLARGRHPEGRAWRVGIEQPLAAAGAMQRIIVPQDFALATSGDAINAYSFAGRRYSHIIDPQTLQPVQNPIASVSVLAPTAMRADALATALMVLGIERGPALANDLGIPALFVVRTEAGLSDIEAGGFDVFTIG